jgi:autotransporter-associated beta strand protein
MALVADSLSLAPGTVGTLKIISTTVWDDLNGVFLTNAPTVTNGILHPGIVFSESIDFGTLRTVGAGSFSGLYQPVEFSAYTDYFNPTVWTPASATEVSRIFFDDLSTGNATLSADTDVYALKFDITGSSGNRGLDLSGHRLTVGSGGIIFARNENEDIDIVGTTPGSELAFGSQTAYLYTHDASGTASSISAPISGTGGLVKSGAGGLELTGTNTFTGGIYINEGSLFLGTNDSLNQNVLTLGPTGVLNIRSTPTTNILAGLNGLGEVRIAGGQGDQTLRIHTADGETHTSSAVLYNVGGTLSVEKSGEGTQIFTGTRAADSTGTTSTGTTTILAGTLVVDGDWSATTGDVIADADSTLSGGGILGGATLIEGTLAPGHLTRRGDLRFLGNLGLAATSELQLDLDSGATRGTTYDAITVGGTFALGGRLSLNVTTLGAAEHRYQLFDFVASTGNFDQVSIVGVHNSTLSRSGNIWSGVIDGRAVSFDQTIGEVIVAAVPVPATCAALAGFGALAFASLRRKPRR